MIRKVKVIGAGSIGNHLSNASRRLSWDVVITDVDPAALERTRSEIYPGRYGAWDEAIRLCESKDAPVGGHDLIVIGTPPHTHLDLALAAISEKPKAVLVEKPICGPGLENAQRLKDEADAAGVRLFVGYDHVVGDAAVHAEALARSGRFGIIETLDVEFREHWGGIFAAHPWLDGPWQTYLGFSAKGGGASGEHSHAINLWQHFSHCLGQGRVKTVQATMDWVRDERVDYDKLCAMTFVTETGFVGRCIQDVVTKPPRKWARMQFQDGHVEWQCGAAPGVDRVTASGDVVKDVAKTRPDDFIRELTHIDRCLDGRSESPIAIERGLDTMLVVAAAHLSDRTGRAVSIHYDRGYTPDALEVK